MRTDTMTLAAFASASCTLGGIGAWGHIATDTGLLEADYYINLARAVERGGFDILFFDDRLAVPAVYGNSPGPAARLGSRALKLDLLTVLALVSSHTSRIGLGATYSTTYYLPYHVARAFATLDHLSGGRAVWNIVTSLNRNEAENFGVEYQDADRRYDRADEFLEIVTGLWQTWQWEVPGCSPLRLDRAGPVFADPDKIRELNYKGHFLSSRGPLSVPAPPQGWPVLLQAGQSGRGMTFASRWADLTFTGPRNLEVALTLYRKQAAALAQAGRLPRAARVLPAVMPFVAETGQIARDKAAYFDTLASEDEELVVLSEQANFDFATVPMDQPLSDDILPQVQGNRGLMDSYIAGARAAFGPAATLRQLLKNQAGHSLARFIGTPAQVADQLEAWFQQEACDGFAIVPTSDPASLEEFGRLVVPELRRRGLVPPPGHERQTLRSRLGLGGRTA